MRHRKKSADGIIWLGFLILLPFFWLYKLLGLAGLGLLVGLIALGLGWYYKRRSVDISTSNEVTTTTVSPIRLEPLPNLSSHKFYEEFFSACWRTINEGRTPPELQSQQGQYFFSHPLNNGHADCIRSLQIIRDSVDIVMSSKKESTILSRMELIDWHANGHVDRAQGTAIVGLAGYRNLFRPEDFERIFARYRDLIREIHTVVYVNLARMHLEKMRNVKTAKTKEKYRQMALEQIQLGLNDPDADQMRLRLTFAEIEAASNLVQNQP